MAAEVESRTIGLYALLNQDQVWPDAQGNRHDISEMSVRYKANVVRYLERRAKHLAALYGYGEIFVLMAEPPGGDMASDALDDALERADHERTNDPLGWLRRTTLLVRLIDDVDAGRGGEDD
jgi:hypothetical protein